MTAHWLNTVSMEADIGCSTVLSFSNTVANYNLSGIVYSVNNMLANASLTDSHAPSNVLLVNLSIKNCPTRIKTQTV